MSFMIIVKLECIIVQILLNISVKQNKNKKYAMNIITN